MVRAYLRICFDLFKKKGEHRDLECLKKRFSEEKLSVETEIAFDPLHLVQYLDSISVQTPVTTEPRRRSTALRGVQHLPPYLPPFYLLCLTGQLQLELATHPRFPFKPLGSVNTKNEITVLKALHIRELIDMHKSKTEGLPAQKKLMASCTLGELREAKRGIEFDLVTEVYWKGSDSGEEKEVIWKCVFSGLSFGKRNNNVVSAESRFLETPETPRTTRELRIPSNAGWNYAKVSGDFNPIHLHWATSKLFGFSKPICHGMWLVSGVIHTSPEMTRWLTEQFGKDLGVTMTCHFRRPVSLGSQTLILEWDDEQPSFIVLDSTNKIQLDCRLTERQQ
ncbi:hypothetical protein K493DRAFT_320325 [Basidiobolus meristosporus CBS 931.73]|uniref:MaoC-like domain-containing protein n=1 Tax=Basidiobolus meristosporus CBS 931.73 TaxID=1314790 RepID=A0A1Y1XB98_9FUNG|nr:hypothetical protein K493DRAFT_320325 [Basidiobolus meristosporus CBS 931.73]|eukprot:ORX83002.1 hypothetical protein K493DRAFT_320325 [Basidiobolus meristosporus CBS 931.73]